MRKILLILMIGCAACAAQTTPLVGFNVPPHGTLNWDIPVNQNFTLLDNLLGGATALPHGLSITGNLTVGGSVSCAPTCNFSTMNVTNAGTFTNTQVNLYVQSILNGCSVATEYQSTQGPQNITESITGCIAIPATSTVHESDGVAGFVNNSSTATNGVGVYGQARALVSNAHVWGANFVGSDNGFSDNEVLGAEVDIVSTNAASQGAGIVLQGTLQANNLFSAIQISSPSTAAWQQGVSFVPVGGLAACKWCIDFQTAATPTPTGTAAAILLNPVAAGVNQVSQGLSFVSNDPSSGQNQVNVNETAAGAFNISTSVAAAGLTVNGVLAGTTLNTGGVYQSKKNVAGCTTAASIGGICGSAITVTWPASFADTNYSVTCAPSGAPTNLPGPPYIVSKANGSVTVNYFAITGSAAAWATIDCEAIHD